MPLTKVNVKVHHRPGGIIRRTTLNKLVIKLQNWQPRKRESRTGGDRGKLKKKTNVKSTQAKFLHSVNRSVMKVPTARGGPGIGQ